MHKIKIHKNVLPCQVVSTGIPGQYVTAPDSEGTWSFVEVCHEDDTGQLVHDYFTWERE